MAIQDAGNIISKYTGIFGDSTGDYSEIYLTDQGFLQIHAEDSTGAVDQTWTIDEAKQMMAKLGHLIWAAENELDV